MIRKLLVLATLLIAITNSALAQTVYTVQNFSKDYYGKVQIDDTSEVFSKGWVAIYDKKTNKRLIKVVSDELAPSLHEGKLFANVNEGPYDAQSLIMYEDFNFDGKKDFAIQDGQNSCYHGPSFRIYLATQNGFSFNEDFTQLAQEYCGMFTVDHRQKKIYAMTKSGCCWHQYLEFIVANNKLKTIKIVTDEILSFPYYKYSEETWNGKSMVTKTYRRMDEDLGPSDLVFSFTIPEKSKKMILFMRDDGTLNYALIKNDHTVEFSYPIETDEEEEHSVSAFQLIKTSEGAALTFANRDATYKIYDATNEVGIEILVGGKHVKWTGDVKTKAGSLEKLFTQKPLNVISQ